MNYGEIKNCPKTTITDENSGRVYHYINVDGKLTLKPYVTEQCWNSTGDKFIVGVSEEESIYEYDTVKEQLKYLGKCRSDAALTAIVTPDDMIYLVYDRGIYRINWNTYERELVTMLPDEVKDMSVIQVTNDGKYATGYYSGVDEGKRFVRINLETGKIDGEGYKDFSYNPNTQGVGHPLINPGYPELMFFCHEGRTQVIPDRLWLKNLETDEMYNMFLQREREDGLTGECSGHEVWGMNGEYMYFVKYNVDQNTVGIRGAVRIKKEGDKGLTLDDLSQSSREYISNKFPFWHCYPTGDDRWVVGDSWITDGEPEENVWHHDIGIASTEKDDTRVLASVRGYGGSHPYHPHPVVSFNGKSVNWQMVDDNNVDGVGWMDISDITSK